MKKNNFILGNGELLVLKAPPKKNSGGKRQEVYTYEESAFRLHSQLEELLLYVNNLPNEATPQNKVIFSLYVHPAYIAKSHFPIEILKYISAQTVGSKPVEIVPSKQLPKQDKTDTNLFYILATKDNIKKLQDEIFSFEKTALRKDIQTIESLTPFYEEDKVKFSNSSMEDEYEIVLHASGNPEDNYIVRDLNTYSKSINNKLSNKFTNSIDGLTFIHAKMNKSLVNNLAKYTFIRAIRKSPKLRDISLNSFSSSSERREIKIDHSQIDDSINVAIFDGGFDEKSLMNKLVEYEDISSVSNDRYIPHGLGVTSAYLFGSIDKEKNLVPYSRVKNYKVLDDVCTTYELLDRIERVLKYEDIEFINLSIGPNQEIVDDDVHYWTALLDKYFSTGEYFACIAAGNTNSRVQVPSDCVNAMAIGAANDDEFIWEKAHYSSIGPGRVPGFIKPDGVAFGGDSRTGKMFKVLNGSNTIDENEGTSFSSPLVLRSAVGIRARYSKDLSPITLKSILIHHAEQNKVENQKSVGWGRFNLDIDDMMTCYDNQTKVIYQGKINVKEFYRAEIPFPDVSLTGMIKIKATFCFTSSTDAEHPPSYTNYGLVATFVPNDDKKAKKTDGTEGDSNKTSSFFTPSAMYTSEDELRRDTQKWETVLHSEQNKRASSLKNPYFEIKYNERENGADSNKKGELSYALIVTVESENGTNIYNDIFNKYKTKLTQVRPRAAIQTKI